MNWTCDNCKTANDRTRSRCTKCNRESAAARRVREDSEADEARRRSNVEQSTYYTPSYDPSPSFDSGSSYDSGGGGSCDGGGGGGD